MQAPSIAELEFKGSNPWTMAHADPLKRVLVQRADSPRCQCGGVREGQVPLGHYHITDTGSNPMKMWGPLDPLMAQCILDQLFAEIYG